MSLREDIDALRARVEELEERIEEIEGEAGPEGEPEEVDGFTEEDRESLTATRKDLAELRGGLRETQSMILTVGQTLARLAAIVDRLNPTSLAAPLASLERCAKRVEEASAALAGQLNLRGRIAAAIRRVTESCVGSGSWNARVNALADMVEKPNFGDGLVQGDLGEFRRG